MIIKDVINSTIIDFINENTQHYIAEYINKINSDYNGLLKNVVNNPNFNLILSTDIVYNPIGLANRCETNSFSFIKNSLLNGIDYYFPVGGFVFVNESLFPVEHWWVYNNKTKKHIEITPMSNSIIYGGVVNFNINDKIKKANNYYDIDFFKGGYCYYEYFK